MRYLLIFFFLWGEACPLVTLASASLTSFSLRSLGLRRVDLAYKATIDPSQSSEENSSFPITWFFSKKWHEYTLGASQPPLESESLPRSLAHRVVPRQYIPLRPKASRTLIPLKVHGERMFLPTPTRHLKPSDIELLTVLDILCKFLRFTLAVLLHLFSSPMGIWRAFEWLAQGWLGLMYDVDRILLDCGEYLFHLLLCGCLLIFPCCKRLLWVFMTVLSLVEVYSELVLLSPVQALDRIALQFERHLEAWKIRQLERDRLRYFSQRIVKRPSTVIRPSGLHWYQPLFHPEARSSLNLLFLPEESSYPVRHIYDPLYLNSVNIIGSGAFGCIFQVEHRITGKMMALKKLARRCNTDEEFDLEIRAMLRVQGSPSYPALLSTFMDADSFYLLMVRSFLFLSFVH